MASELLQLMLAGMEKEESRSEREIGRALQLLESASARKHATAMQDDQQEFLMDRLDDEQSFAEQESLRGRLFEERMMKDEIRLSKQKEKDLYKYKAETLTTEEAEKQKEDTEKSIQYLEDQSNKSLESIIAPFAKKYTFAKDESNLKDISDQFEEAFDDFDVPEHHGTEWLNAIILAQAGDNDPLINLMSDLKDRNKTLAGFEREVDVPDLDDKGKQKKDADGKPIFKTVTKKLGGEDAHTKSQHESYINALNSLGIFGDTAEESKKRFNQAMGNVEKVFGVLDKLAVERTELQTSSLMQIMTDDKIRDEALQIDLGGAKLPELLTQQEIHTSLEHTKAQDLINLSAGLVSGNKTASVTEAKWDKAKALRDTTKTAYQTAMVDAKDVLFDHYISGFAQNYVAADDPSYAKKKGLKALGMIMPSRMPSPLGNIEWMRNAVKDDAFWKEGDVHVKNKIANSPLYVLYDEDEKMDMLRSWGGLKDQLTQAVIKYDTFVSARDDADVINKQLQSQLSTY